MLLLLMYYDSNITVSICLTIAVGETDIIKLLQ